MARKKRFNTRAEYLRWRYWKDIDKSRKESRDRVRLWRKNNPEKARKRDKIEREKYKERRAAYNKEYQKHYRKDKEKYIARMELNNAIKLGKVIRPDICENCNEKGFIEAHHTDYKKTLEVEWLCIICHSKKHYPYQTTTK